MPKCSSCRKRRKLDPIGICKECGESLDPSERSVLEDMVKQGLPIGRCSECLEMGTVDRDGLCEGCLQAAASWESRWYGGICCRCDLALEKGYCPNDRCPYVSTYQDESNGDWEPPDGKERRYIDTVIRPRLENQ